VSNSDRVKGVGLFSGGPYGVTSIGILGEAVTQKSDECDYNEYFKKSEEQADAGPFI